MEGNGPQDEALRAAIAASLQTPGAQGRRGEVVDLTADSDDERTPETNIVEIDEAEEDDEDLLKAIEMSLENRGSPSPAPVATEKEKNVAPAPKEESNPGPARMPCGIPGLDRKKQEEERLARLAKKRKATSISPPPVMRESKMGKPETSGINDKPRSAKQTTSFEKPESRRNLQPEKNGTGSHSSPKSKSKSALQFPTGVVKKTWAYGHPRVNDDIKIEEVLEPSDLKLAVLSSFQWDMEWLFSKLDLTSTICMLVMQAKDDATKHQYKEETASMKNLALCFPPMEAQVNCMHSKLMLLFHEDHLRIAVPSANLVPYDWGESGVMENSVFLIDLPRKSESQKNQNSTRFYRDLVYFLRASTLKDTTIEKLSWFDFSQTANIGFVHSIGGSHSGVSWGRTGLSGLGRAVKEMGLKTTQPLKIDFVTSSVGSLTDEFLRSMYLASQGDDGLTELTLRNSKKFPTKRIDDPSVSVSKETGSEWKNRFRVYFPSEKTVKDSRGGPGAGGTICFQSKWFDGAKFPKQVLRDCISRRPRILMHSKMLLVRPEENIILPDGSNCTAWAYVGSANLSESAWGRPVMDRTTKQPKLNCRNWECGVLLPICIPDKSDDDEGTRHRKAPKENTSDDIDIANVFGDTIPIPMKVPAPCLGPRDRPWFNNEY